MNDEFVTGLVLGAGGSKRLGRPKQLLAYGDGTLLGHVVDVARACAFDQLVVALGGAAGEVRHAVDLQRADVVVNDAYGEGCSSSIAKALGAVDLRCTVLVLMLGDQPGVTPATVRALLAGRGDAPIAVCHYDDARGHPIAFSHAIFGELGELHGDKGVWRLLDEYGDDVAEVAIEGPIPPDVDTEEDYAGVVAARAGALPATGEPEGELRAVVPDIETLAQRLAAVDYLVDEGLATSMFLSVRLPQPLLLEGQAGVGKTEAAKALAAVLDTPLIRLQCYEGIDAAEALYEWNYPRQLLSIRLADSSGETLREEDLFGPDYLIRRPLLRALEHPGPRPAVLLIDEIDRADDDFEAFLLELLAEASVTIPELGTIRATHPPIIVLTSNRTRDLHDAVKRRCLYHWIAYPTPQREVEIVRRRVRGASEALAVHVADAVSRMRDSDIQKPPGIAEAIDWVAALSLLGVETLDVAAIDRTLGAVLKYDEDQDVIRAAGLDQLVGRSPPVHTRAGCAAARRGDPVGLSGARAFGVETIHLDLPPLTVAFSRRLQDAGVPTTPARQADLARALTLVRPVSRRRLYWTARAVLVSDPAQIPAFDRVFFEVFGDPHSERFDPDEARAAAAPRDDRPAEDPRRARGDGSVAAADDGGDDDRAPIDVPLAMASDEERLAGKSFDALEPHELAQLYRLMARLRLVTPIRRTRRYEKGRHGQHIDMRRTLRASRRTAGDPIHLARRHRREVRRRLVMLCDISGSMEPYARAYLQFLASAAGSGQNAEAFVFATRLTRLTRALASRHPERAIQRAAAAAPDWSSGTRIGDALKTFNDRHGRRGMARGAVIVILSDGWERGDPALVGREMARLARLAHRIVWVNPRVSASAFSVRAGGMLAALPYCDALVSGHSFRALADVAGAIGADTTEPPDLPPDEEGEPAEPWASATPVPGSSVAMPSGHGPSRGNATPGWVTDDGA